VSGRPRGPQRSPEPASGTGRRLREAPFVGALLLIHAALATWGSLSSSVTFDENFHLPAGVAILARREFGVSPAQPPLVKTLCAAVALAAGARPPAAVVAGDEAATGESFMRVNADRYQRVYLAGRLVILAFSLALGVLVWRFARRLYGGAAGLLALALYAFSPEALAHAGLVGMDLATGLAFTVTIFCFYRFIVAGDWRWWGLTALALGAAFLTRFSAIQLAPVLAAQALAATVLGRARRPGQLWLGLLLFVPAVLVAVNLGYLGQDSFVPLARYQFTSESFKSLQARFPTLRLPLPRECVKGLNYIALMSQPGGTPSFLLGRIREEPVWYYFPLALLFKWPLGFMGALIARAALPFVRGVRRRRVWIGVFLAIPMVVILGTAMFGSSLNVGVRYLFPIIPLACIWCGAVAGRVAWAGEASSSTAPRARAGVGSVRHAPARNAWLWVGVAVATLQAAESALAAPWFLSFYNWPAGGPGGGYRLVNDSNVDWGQGLIALRRELESRGISRIYLAYHGTADPALYGIDYVPYLGGAPGAESDWIAVSSYYLVGLSQRMMTRQGRTTGVRFQLEELERRFPAARPARCMFLYRVRWNGRPL
jgi:hypothetical protein